MFKLNKKIKVITPIKGVILPSGKELLLREKIRYLAVDKNGELWGFSHCPVIITNENTWDRRTTTLAEHLGYTSFTGDWKKSLMKIVKGTAVFVKQKKAGADS